MEGHLVIFLYGRGCEHVEELFLHALGSSFGKIRKNLLREVGEFKTSPKKIELNGTEIFPIVSRLSEQLIFNQKRLIQNETAFFARAIYF
jgi:hypothetical protein